MHISDTNSRVATVESDVATIEGDVAAQDDRITVLETSVELLDQRIIVLENANTDILERLTALADTVSCMFEDTAKCFFSLWTTNEILKM